MGLCNVIRKLFSGAQASAGGARITYCLPNVAIHRKWYNQDTFFDEVDWNDWPAVVDGFEARFNKWYFAHLHGGHASYVDFCAICALVEVFSHYDLASDWHEPKNYREFLRKLDPDFRTNLKRPIQITRCEAGKWKPGKLKDFADVFYAGVRCSLHHHGDLASYAGMSGTGKLAVERENAGVSRCGTHTYSLVVFDPEIVKNKLHDWLQEYCRKLRTSRRGSVAIQFRKTFENDFGITIAEP